MVILSTLTNTDKEKYLNQLITLDSGLSPINENQSYEKIISL